LPPVPLENSGDEVEEGGLPRPVGTDDSHDFPFLDPEAGLVHGQKIIEGFDDGLNFQHLRGAPFAPFLSPEFFHEIPHDPLGQEEDQQDEDDSQDQGPVLGVFSHERPQGDGDARPQDRTAESEPSSQEAHDEDLQGESPEQEVGKDGFFQDDEQDPGNPGEEGADDDGPELVAADIDSHSLAPLRVVPDGLERAPERRFQDQIEEDQRDHQDDQNKVIGLVQGGEKRRHGDPVDAVVAPGEFVPPVNNGPDEGPQRDLEHAEVEPRQPDAEPADDQAGQRGEDGRGHKPDPQGEGGLGQQESDRVSPHPVKDGVVELIHPAIAHQEIQAHGQEGSDVDEAEDINEKPGDQGRHQEKEDKNPGVDPKPVRRISFFCPMIHYNKSLRYAL